MVRALVAVHAQVVVRDLRAVLAVPPLARQRFALPVHRDVVPVVARVLREQGLELVGLALRRALVRRRPAR